MIITAETFQTWNRFYRGNFINSLSGFKSASLIGTINKEGQTNLAIFSNIVHLGADPALIGYMNRPLESAPHTLANIEATGEYTINHIHAAIVEQAHQTSAKYPQHVSEFEAVGLTPQYVANVRAPFVKESAVKYALTLEEIIPIALNNTFFVIGRVDHVILEQDIIQPDGFLALDQAGTICSSGLDGYYHTEIIHRYKYAKPGIPVEKIE